MEGTLPFYEPGEFNTESVNSELAQKEQTAKVIKEKTEQVKKKAQEIEELIVEESPKWKENFKKGLDILQSIGENVFNKISTMID